MTTYGSINDDTAIGIGADADWSDILPTSPVNTPPASASPSVTQPAMRESLAQRRRGIIKRCTDVAKSAGKRLLFGMTTSLALQSVPLPDGCDPALPVLHTVSSNDDRRTRLADPSVKAHIWHPIAQYPDANVCINKHVYALDLFHTWAQLANHLTLESMIVLGDAIITATSRQAMLAQGRDVSAIHRDLVGFTDTLPKFRGNRTCRNAVMLIRAGVDSPTESRIRLSLLRHGLPDMTLNHVVPGAMFRSGTPMTLDLAWPEHQVAVEYDGDHHRTDKTQWRRDQEKRDRLRSRGWLIFIATGATLVDAGARAELAFHVARALMTRGAEFPFRVLEAPSELVAKEARKRTMQQ